MARRGPLFPGVPSLQELATRHILHNADEHMVNIVTTPDEVPPTLVARLREGVSKRSGGGKHGIDEMWKASRRNLKENESSCPHSTPKQTRETIPQKLLAQYLRYRHRNMNFM